MLNSNIELKVSFPDKDFTEEELNRIPNDLKLIKRINFMMGSGEDVKGVRRVRIVYTKGRFSGYKIEDFKLEVGRNNPDYIFLYSANLVKEVTLEELDEIQKTLEELKTKPYLI